MEKNDIFKKIIEEKKLNDSKKKPKYATRKLSMGLVSCMLGYALLVSPSSVEAAELDSNNQVVAEETETKEEAITNNENVVEEKQEENIETPAEESVEEKTTEEKQTQEAPVEEKSSEEATPQEASEEDKKEENASELEMAEETKPEAVSAEETREAKDVSNDIQSKYVALTEEGHETKGTVKPDAGEAIGWEVSFTSPKGTKAGDYFTIDLSDNLSLKGIEPDHENEYPIDIDGKVVADGVRVDRSTIKYTFNENINDERNVVVSVKGFAYIDKTKVPNNTPDEKISIKLGDTVDEHNINVQYGDPYYTGDNLNGMSQFTEFNPKTGEFTQVFYINPDSKTITTSTRNWATGKVVAFIDGITPDGSHSDVNYTDKDTTVTVQKLPAGTKVPDGIIENPVTTDEPTMVKTTFRDGGIEIVFADNSDDNLRKNNIDSPYIITVKSIAAPSKTGNNVYSRATLYGDGSKFHIMDNSIVTTVGDTEAEGEKIGYFKEHHVYYTKVDGVLQEDKTFTLHSNKTEGHDYDKYFTSKNVIDDFKFIKVDTDKLVENPVYNEDGTIARGNYEPGKTKEVTYIYERDITSGKFQEHHIYQTVDEKGNVISTDDTVNKDETKGIDEDSYKTSKIDRDGYTLTEVKATNDQSAKLGVKFDSKGAETTGNYVNGEKLEVTYIYQKTEKKGSFKETHVYKTLDFEGNVIEDKTITKPGKSTEGTKEESYTSSKVDKDGYVFTKVTADKGSDEVTISKDGKEVQSGNYVEDKELAVTYEYVKQPGRFIEHHIYKTVDKDGKEISTDYTVNNPKEGEPAKEGYSNEKISTAQQPKDGYKYNSETTLESENYVPGKTLEKTYVYVKTQNDWTPIEETGKFQEHHIYITKDKNGKEIKREVENVDVSGGTKDMTYETGKKEKDGFEFVRTENPIENPSYNEQGESTTGKFKPGVKQEITYVYEKIETPWTPLEPSKPVEEKGSFQEHHIYITKDENGKVIKREVVDGKVSDGTKDMSYTTGKAEKDGFKFVRTENPVEDPRYNEKGESTIGNFKPGVKQEITYVYEKIVTPWTELEKPRKQEKPSNSNETDKKIVKENKTNDDTYKVKYVEPSSTSDNVQTGVSSLSGIIATLSASLGGLIVSKKRKNK